MNVTLYGKRDFVNVNRLKIMKWGDYPRLLMFIRYNNYCLSKRSQSHGEGDVMTEAEIRVIDCENEGRGHFQAI